MWTENKREKENVRESEMEIGRSRDRGEKGRERASTRERVCVRAKEGARTRRERVGVAE